MRGRNRPASYLPRPRAARMSKYYLAYLLMGLLIALGVFVVCRPSRRFDPDTDA